MEERIAREVDACLVYIGRDEWAELDQETQALMREWAERLAWYPRSETPRTVELREQLAERLGLWHPEPDHEDEPEPDHEEHDQGNPDDQQRRRERREAHREAEADHERDDD